MLLCSAMALALILASRAAAGPVNFDDIDAAVMHAMQVRGVPGAAIAIVEGNQVSHIRGFGRADPSGRPVSADTPFRIGSNTKSFTALAVMQLVEDGSVRLDASVREYLPWFELAARNAADSITVSDLLYHTSGIPENAEYESFTDPALTLEEYGRRLKDVRPDRPVGGSFEYSNANYNLLGLIVEAVSGQKYAAYIREHIFEPLSMRHSSAAPTEPSTDGLARGYKWWFGWSLPAGDPYNQANAPAGYIASTAEDLSHYLIAQLNDGRYGNASVLSPQGIALMHAVGHNTQTTRNGIPTAYSMGWGVVHPGGRTILEHNGATFAFASQQILDLGNRHGLVVLTNAQDQLSYDEHVYAIGSAVFQPVAGLAFPPRALDIRIEYVLIDTSVLIASGLMIVALVRSGRRRSPVRAGLEIAAAVLIVLSPYLLGYNWPLLLNAQPDLASWGLLASGLVFFTGLWRIMRSR